MKASVKLQDDHQSHLKAQPHAPPILLRAKIPISIFDLPFLSQFSTTTTHPSDLSLSLSTNFPSGPSLKLSYSTTTSSSAAATTPPLSLTLKSGTGLFGSPNNSPLVINANFSFNPSNPNHPNPTFSITFKPQMGSFSLRKTTFSHKKTDNINKPDNGEASFGTNSFGFVPLERPGCVKEFEGERIDKDSIFKGISVMARTQMVVAKRVALNCRWSVNFPEDFEKKMPFLKINKIGIERVDEVVKEEKKKNEGNSGDLEVFKGMCVWMKRELDVLQKENRVLKGELEELKAGHLLRNNSAARKKGMPVVESPSGESKQWRNKKSAEGEENGNVKKEAKKNGARPGDLENELQRAIEAAAAAS
ncbi:uncharacterized protein LOC111404616 [Olea europaea var. sylvestris]|uniref:Uncharacterized protein n=1 Tax=Olea europaea subsp. europaea TaxID=158383 RepID=A0A8S0PTC3_OLEEU|nr:uncharacterized protein LOC111404616 [Olea europaea var. sylvestris]CAA2954689.1 Hypothetical predicted protein [Olea europaea subsp. europaea]